MIPFKEYLTENWGNLSKFHRNSAKKIIDNRYEVYCSPDSKIVRAKSKGINIIKEFNILLKRYNNGKAVIIFNNGDQERVFYYHNDNWLSYNPEYDFEEILKFEVDDVSAVYFVAPDDEGLIKNLAKDSPIPKHLITSKIDASAFTLLYDGKIRDILKRIKRKFKDLKVYNNKNIISFSSEELRKKHELSFLEGGDILEFEKSPFKGKMPLFKAKEWLKELNTKIKKWDKILND